LLPDNHVLNGMLDVIVAIQTLVIKVQSCWLYAGLYLSRDVN
jgi:hypothetical protein